MRVLLANISSVVLIISMVFSLPSHPLIVHLSDLQTMAKRSDLVAHGYVGDKRVVNDNLGRLITLTDIEVIDGLHGAKTGEIVTVYQVGGEKDGIVMPLLGGQVYHLHQEVILFGLTLGDTYVSYGAGQGKLDITLEDGKDCVREDLGDISAVDRNSGGRKLYRPTPLSFDNKEMLKDEIRLMLK
ncbi:MAG TPA: hypothetical protein VEK06_03330 [Myxococcota bacterium]|nr:hypothetical protein [Myxococcota bacterium]